MEVVITTGGGVSTYIFDISLFPHLNDKEVKSGNRPFEGIVVNIVTLGFGVQPLLNGQITIKTARCGRRPESFGKL